MNAAVKANGHIDWTRYRLDSKLSIPRRICEALNWAAEKHPGAFVDYRILAKTVMGYSRTPAFDSKDVERVRSAKSSANKLLLTQYNREIIVERDVGLRASVDDGDKAKHVLTRKVSRLDAATRSVEQTAASIDVRRIPNTPEWKTVREFAARTVKGLLPVLQSEEWRKRLLPPAEPEQ